MIADPPPDYAAAEKLCEGLWRLAGRHMPCFLIEGKESAAIFEVGISISPPLVLAQLDALGLPREKVAYVILSHAHTDHATGQAGIMAGLKRARLLMTGPSARHLAKESTAKQFAEEDAFTSRAMLEQGLPVRPGETPYLPLLPQPWELISPGDRIDLGGVGIELLESRGHVPGGVVAWLPEREALLASDSAGFCHSNGDIFPLYFTSYDQYMDSLAMMAELKPEVLALGHQKWFSGAEAGGYLTRVREVLEAGHREIHKQNKQGQNPEEQAKEFFERLYHGDLTIYQPQSIRYCCQLLVRRSLESVRYGESL